MIVILGMKKPRSKEIRWLVHSKQLGDKSLNKKQIPRTPQPFMCSPVQAAFNAPAHKEEHRRWWEDPGFCPAASSFLQAGKETVDYDGYEDRLRYSVLLWGREKMPILGKCSLVPGPDFCLKLSFRPLIAQLVKNLLAMEETLVWFLGWADPLEKG